MFRQPFTGNYVITLDYGEKFPPLYTDESPHRGIDYGTPIGTKILASEDGTVTTVASLSVGYGNYVLIKHADGYETVYAHLSQILVRQGQAVSQGDVIGLSGNTGNSTGPHLHFEVRKNGIKIDPKTVLHSVLDSNPNTYTPNAEKPEFEAIRGGLAIVCCDLANVRCHCDMSRVIKTLPRDSIISVSETVTVYNGLPYRQYWDGEKQCLLMIAEHDPYDQIIRNYEQKF